MLVRLCWPECNYWDGEWGAVRLDAVWVECSADEARALVHPRLSAEKVQLSERYGESGWGAPTGRGRPAPTYCFLVSTDLARIDPHPAIYPWSGQWNAYCPFRRLGERRVGSLDGAVARGGRPRRPWWRFWGAAPDAEPGAAVDGPAKPGPPLS